MDEQSTISRKTQLGKEEREHLEDVVIEMRERVEANVRYQLEKEHNVDQRPDDDITLTEEQQKLVEAIELDVVDGNDWDDGYEQYITGVGYTIVNRLAALRCMEVRGFLDDEVTVFRDDGLTPAADRLVTEEFMLEEEAVIKAYRNACDSLAEEIEILFDRSTAYSLIDPDDATFKDLCGMLDEVPDGVWRTDDVLGWAYEYYNHGKLSEIRHKAHNEGLDPNDIAPANQFYTPHWVVRLLTDNSLGRLYAESTGRVEEILEEQQKIEPDDRVERIPSIEKSPDIASLCTYMTPSEGGEAPEFDHPSEIKVIDPACGSGHFLLYAYDLLERIWLDSDENIDPKEIPEKILKYNLFGVDIDLRACQLATFNLYLKARTKARSVNNTSFRLPEMGIVCADTAIADVSEVEQIFNRVASNQPDVRDALDHILSEFKNIDGLGSLLDVKGTLSDEFLQKQTKLTNDWDGNKDLTQFLHQLHDAISKNKTNSFAAQDLNSFLRLLVVLSQDYDVALMNPPYGSKKKMPNSVQQYVREQYEYTPEYYINFFESCDRLVKPNGRIGMLIPRTFMMKRSMKDFRKDFVGTRGSFDFLAEFGLGILDNATVRTVGTVVRTGYQTDEEGTFIRLHDVEKGQKERVFSNVLNKEYDSESADRLYTVQLSEFEKVPGTPLSYYTPTEIRELHSSNLKIDPNISGIKAKGIAKVAQGIVTGNNQRFIRYHWESSGKGTKSYAKGGEDAWILPHISYEINWQDSGNRIKRYYGSRFQNSEYYGREGLSWTTIKETGRRFGYIPSDHLFDQAGSMVFLQEEYSPWVVLATLNSTLYHGLFLSITPERQWTQGEVGRIPWYKLKLDDERLTSLVKQQYQTLVAMRTDDPTSVYYIAPSYLHNEEPKFFYDNAVRNPEINASEISHSNTDASAPITDSIISANKEKIKLENETQKIAKEIDESIYQSLSISSEARTKIIEEIYLRTAEEPEDREFTDPDTISDSSQNYHKPAKDLIHHFVMKSVREQDDGIIPLNSTRDNPDVVDQVIEQFHEAYGECAEDHLVEVDDILGTESAADEAYPNLRSFIKNDLFDYHVDTMENTPMFWKLSTERLLADANKEGFACFVDYHQLDASLFDGLSNRYLEPRKVELRERRSAANKRRDDGSLSISEQAGATEQFRFCTNALEQIAKFEEVMQELGSTSERDFDDKHRKLVAELAPKIATFREETAERIDMLAELRERKGKEWFQDTFSNNFWKTIDKYRNDWLDALDNLQYACEEYAKPNDEPVEAHLADLFEYFNSRLKGSDHYASTGILFMTYYFEREGTDMLNESGEPFENLTQNEQMLASLATGLDSSIVNREYLEQLTDGENTGSIGNLPPLAEFKALAEEISDRCQTIHNQLHSDWSKRALSEITTAGYQPSHKHGVAINITPLARRDIVPKIVDDKVL